MADWLSGYAAEWSVAVVDPDTWEDAGMLEGAVPSAITRDSEGDSPLLETGELTIDAEDRFTTEWLRIYLTARDADAVKVPIATMLFERESCETERRAPRVSCRGRSVLQPAADVDLLMVDPKGYAPAGCDGAEYAARLLGACTPAPVTVEGSFTLNESYNFEPEAKCLESAWKVLGAGNFVIQVSGRGEITVMPMPTVPELELAGANAGLLVPGVADDYSLIDVPNRYTATLDGQTATAVNDDPESDSGRPRRGRWVDAPRDTSPTLINGEDLQAYAERRLREESVVKRTYSYTREFVPEVTCFDLVSASLAENGLEGELRISRQTVTCGKGATVEEEAYEEVS